MAFVHKVAGKMDHRHETTSEARLCEQGFETTTTVRDGDLYREAKHQTPCVCTVYDRCREFRAADARHSGNWRDLHRAYND